MDNETQGTVYLLHFDKPLSHAQHYLGWTNDLPKRLKEHKRGTNSKCKLTEAIKKKGISFVLARTWKGPISKEKSLKRQKNGRKLCPICTRERNV